MHYGDFTILYDYCTVEYDTSLKVPLVICPIAPAELVRLNSKVPETLFLLVSNLVMTTFPLAPIRDDDSSPVPIIGL